MALSVGTKAPDFSLKSKQASGLVDVKLSGNFGRKNTLLLFFPLAFTSVCTQEMCDITQGINAYAGLNADVIGISVDSPFDQQWEMDYRNWGSRRKGVAGFLVGTRADHERDQCDRYGVGGKSVFC